jgi:hypothetical protein
VKETLRRSPKGLTAFYQRLIANGKTLVAITGVMRTHRHPQRRNPPTQPAI